MKEQAIFIIIFTILKFILGFETIALILLMIIAINLLGVGN